MLISTRALASRPACARALFPCALLLLSAGLAAGQQIGAVATPPSLQDAAAAGDAAAVERMLREGADVEQREAHGRTPLYSAAREGRTDLVLALLAAGAQPGARNDAGLTPLHIAAERGHAPVVRALLASCSEVDARDLQQRTPLFFAAAQGQREVVELLLAGGADLRARLRGGSTPLDAAIRFRHQDVADALRERLAQTPENALPEVAAAPRLRGDVERIQFVQQKLRELGYEPGPVDGQMADKTRKAIQSFQRDIGQVANGELTPCLIERISAELRRRQPGSTPPGASSPAGAAAPATAPATGVAGSARR